MKQPVLKALIEAGSVREVDVIGQGSVFGIRFRVGMTQHVLETARGGARTFAGLQPCAAYLRSLGIGHIRVDLTGWTPDQKGF